MYSSKQVNGKEEKPRKNYIRNISEKSNSTDREYGEFGFDYYAGYGSTPTEKKDDQGRENHRDLFPERKIEIATSGSTKSTKTHGRSQRDKPFFLKIVEKKSQIRILDRSMFRLKIRMNKF